MKILLFVLSVVISVIILLLAVYFSRLQTSKSKSTYFYLRIKKMSIDFRIADDKNKFDEYPLIKEQILNVVKLIKIDQEFDVRNIIIYKQKFREIVDNDSFDRVKAFKKEYDICCKKDKDIIKILNEANDIRNGIIKYRFPIRSAFDKYIFMAKLRILMLIVKILIFLEMAKLFLEKLFSDTKDDSVEEKLTELRNNEKIVDKYKNEDSSGFSFPGELRMN